MGGRGEEKETQRRRREREREKGKKIRSLKVQRGERKRDRESSHDFLFLREEEKESGFGGAPPPPPPPPPPPKGRRACEEMGVVKKLLKGWDSGIINVPKAKPKVKSKCAPVRSGHVVQILSSLQPMRAGNNSAADLSLDHVSVVHVR